MFPDEKLQGHFLGISTTLNAKPSRQRTHLELLRMWRLLRGEGQHLVLARPSRLR